MTIKKMEDFFIKREKVKFQPTNRIISMFFRTEGEKYGFDILYTTCSTGIAIGLNYQWPEAPKDENVMISSMITEYDFKKFSYGITVLEDAHDIYFLVFKYRGKFYVNFVIITEDNEIKQAELMEFKTKEDMLEIADNVLWHDFRDEIHKFIGEADDSH